jgi:predicted transcriptional regulator
MNNKRERDYITKHRQIRQKLVELTRENKHACVNVSRLASQVGMDVRTVRSHLRVMEMDALGVFIDPGEKEFCTKEGVSLLAKTLKLNDKASE